MGQIKSDSGFSLVEVLVALVVLIVVILALVFSSITSLSYSTQNLLRDEAVRLATEFIEGNLNCTHSNATNSVVIRRIRNAYIAYNVTCVSQQCCGLENVRKVTVTVTWKYKGQLYSYSTETIVDVSQW